MLTSFGTAAEHYFYRPALGFFRAFMLEEYARAGIEFRAPVLDLGCGDGTFGAALVTRGVMRPADIGLDGCRVDLRDAMPGLRHGGVCADLTTLPIRGGSIGTVLSNAVLSSLMSPHPDAIHRSLTEVRRVLQDDGCFARDLLRRLGAEAAERRYVARVNRRHSITPRLARRYSTLHLARGFPVLQRLLLPGLQRWAAGAQAAAFPQLFGRLFAEEQAVPQEERRADAGFVLLVARTLATPA